MSRFSRTRRGSVTSTSPASACPFHRAATTHAKSPTWPGRTGTTSTRRSAWASWGSSPAGAGWRFGIPRCDADRPECRYVLDRNIDIARDVSGFPASGLSFAKIVSDSLHDDASSWEGQHGRDRQRLRHARQQRGDRALHGESWLSVWTKGGQTGRSRAYSVSGEARVTRC